MIHKYEHAIKKFTTFNANLKKINEKEKILGHSYSYLCK